MTEQVDVVDWYAYAQQYDLLLDYNPYYQEALEKVMQEVQSWDMQAGDCIADLGAGTGNYSVRLAALFPQLQIIHLENNRGMNALAAKKAAHLDNFEFLNLGIEQADFAENTLDGLLCINALYTFPKPPQMIHKMYQWLRPGAKAILLDPGRIMNLWGWKWAIARHLIWTYGLRKSWYVFQQAKSVSAQNAHIRDQQRNGQYWLHTHEEFCNSVETAGFKILSSDTCFRGDCDLIIAQK